MTHKQYDELDRRGTMTTEHLNELADALDGINTPRLMDPEGGLIDRAADYLRQCAQAEPIHAYEWDTYGGGVHRSFSASTWNGREPDRVVLLYTRPAPQPQLAQADDDAAWCDAAAIDVMRALDREEAQPERQPVREPTEAQIEAAAREYAGWNHRIVFGDEELMRRVAADMLRAALAAKE